MPDHSPGRGVAASAAGARFSGAMLFTVVFIEGYASLGAEVLALRRLLPHIGSSIVVTAPTIGFFLLALALGYHAGGRLSGDLRPVLARNFLLSALLVGAGMSRPGIDLLFASGSVWLGATLLIAGVMAPVAYLLGQTVPALTLLMRAGSVAARSGNALFWSTLGSFLGSLTLSLGVMQFWGVSLAAVLCALLLLGGYLLLAERRGTAVVLALAVGGAVLATLPGDLIEETAYADYEVRAVQPRGEPPGRALLVNNSPASILYDAAPGEPLQPARYIRHLRSILVEQLAFRDRAVLVLGAGGFSLSLQEAANRYTYVDIDPAIRGIAEQRFLGAAARGRFVVDDARRFVAHTDERFAAVVVDVYSSHLAIPRHLLTREFWQAARRPLETDGVLLTNLVLDSRLQSAYARNLLATIESVWGRCATEVLFRDRPLSNVIVVCHRDSVAAGGRAGSLPARAHLYVDERNDADLDAARAAP